MTEVDVAIVGGGMVGLTLAQLFAKALPKLSVAVMDAQAVERSSAGSPTSFSPSFDQRSTALSRSSIATFERLGLWQPMRRHATAIRAVHVSDRGHVGATQFNPDEKQELPGFVVSNEWLGQQLLVGLEQCSQVKVFAPFVAQRLSPRAGYAEISAKAASEQGAEATSSEQTLRAKLVVIADGAHSPLRQQLGIGLREYDYHQHAVIANVSFDKSHRGVAYERFTANGPLALLPLGESANARSSALVWTHPSRDVEQVMQYSDAEFLQQLQCHFGFRLGRFTRVGARASYPLRLMQATEQVRSNIVLMGNAAHFLHPVAGQGFNLALRDCVRLVRCVEQAQNKAIALGALSTLNEYAQAQSVDQWLTTELSHSFTRLFSNDQKWAQGIRNMGLMGLAFCPPLQRSFFSQMMGTGVKQIQQRRL